MRFTSSFKRLAALSLGWMFAANAMASEESQLVDAINSFRNQAQRCGDQVFQELPPLNVDTRLVLSATSAVDLQQAMARATYPMVNVQAISLSGPRDAQSAMGTIQESFCRVVLDPQFVDIGVSREGRDWRIVLARPLLTARLGNSEDEGQKLLALINTARAQPQQCGAQAMSATTALTWQPALASAAENHSRGMANNNFFDHMDRGQQIGENIAAGQGNVRKVVDGWLASPGHCANLMNPRFHELGAAYAVDPKSDAGIYWTAMFGAQ
jgi:uncharacterized protein YkwD